MLTVNKEICSGAICFSGTRITIRAIRNYIEHGASDQFIKSEYPTLTDEQLKLAHDWNGQ